MNTSVIRQKDASQNGYQGVINVRFSENVTCFVFLKHPFWDSSFNLENRFLSNWVPWLTCQLTFTCSKSTREKIEKIVTIKASEIFLKLKIKTVKWFHWRRYGVCVVNFDHALHFSNVSSIEFEHVNVSWVHSADSTNYVSIGRVNRALFYQRCEIFWLLDLSLTVCLQLY